MWSGFEALIPYFGGKRSLCPAIFKEIGRVIPQADWQDCTLVDGFTGGGAVSLYAKAQGMRVISNDLADRSRIVIDSLIVNDRVTLSEEDLARLFVGSTSSAFVEQNFVPAMFMRKHAQFLDQALGAVDAIEHRTKAQLLRLALVKYMLKITPYSQIHSVNYFQSLEDEEYHRLGRSRTKKIPYTCMPAIRILQEARAQINRAVFPNGQINEARQMDVFQCLDEVQADICYLDPPYAGAQPYEVFYGVLDQILERRRFEPKVSDFNSQDAKRFLQQLLEAARKFRVVVLSYGSQRYSFEEFQQAVQAVEPAARCYPLNFRYAFTRKSDAESVRKELLAVITR
ncbi:MAG: hypothetical protein HOO67_06430 [Candidatus Peribacteraceae bacterium]|nr:hypothetical protein [Candidatus Peribacteraceae bacterium]